jgi:hypothetical protein
MIVALLLMTASLMIAPTAYAVSTAEDIAIAIMLKGYECGGRQVTDIREQKDGRGGTITRATCPNGIRYEIVVTPEGRMHVRRVN